MLPRRNWSTSILFNFNDLEFRWTSCQRDPNNWSTPISLFPTSFEARKADTETKKAPPPSLEAGPVVRAEGARREELGSGRRHGLHEALVLALARAVGDGELGERARQGGPCEAVRGYRVGAPGGEAGRQRRPLR